MTAGGKPGKRTDDAPRHVYGPRPVGALVPALTRPAFRKRAPGGAQVMADWAEIVGPELSTTTVPRRLSGSTLTLACTGPVALELQHLSDQVLARVNSHMGRIVVRRLRFIQDPTPPPARPPSATPPAMKRIELPGIPPGPLHDALIALGRRIGDSEPA
jgi:hypothetical protein